MAKQYWLFKSEPDVYSFDDLKREGSCYWDGVRNYQARNFLRDTIEVGDGVFFYHSRVKPMAIVGCAEVVKAGYPDHTQFIKNTKYFDPKSDPENPRWYMVDIAYKHAFRTPMTLDALKEVEGIENMVLINRSRLSIQPVQPQEWKIINKLGGKK